MSVSPARVLAARDHLLRVGYHDVAALIAERVTPPVDLGAIVSVWPLTVCLDRYAGHFSGGAWLAFHAYPHDVPRQPFEDDPAVVAAFWERMHHYLRVDQTPTARPGVPLWAVGRTAELAVARLRKKVTS